MDAAELIRAELQSISADISEVVVVDTARHKQCVHAASMEEAKAEAEAKVVHLKCEVQAAQDMLQLANEHCQAAESECNDVQQKLVHLRDYVVATEEASLAEKKKSLEDMKDKLASLLSEVSVYKALNAEIKRGTR